MRHLKKGRKLGRTASHRKATMQSLASALIEHKQIQTTLAKAKELRRFVEPLVTRAKEDTSHNRRMVFSSLQNKDAVTELFNEVGPAVGDRPGGYTRVLKLGFRHGDSTEMALIELVDFSDYEPESKEQKKKKTRRAGRTKKTTSAAEETPETVEKTEAATDEVVKQQADESSETETEVTDADTASEEKETEVKKEEKKTKKAAKKKAAEAKEEETKAETEEDKSEEGSEEEKK